MSTSAQRRLSSGSLVLLALAFIAAVIISNQLFTGWRIDLTENKLYTLSDGTKRVLQNIDEPINLYFYFSDRATESLPPLRSYANRVREMLEEFADRSDGKIRLRVVDPLPFSEEEDRAAQFDLQGIQLATTPDPIYLGLAGTNSVGDESTISFFQPDKEEFLEYDIAKLVSTLAQPGRTVVGLISGARMSGDFDPQTQQMLPAWVIYQQAQQLFDVRDLGADLASIDADIGLLWIVQPKDLADETLYAIDQFLLRGGKALIFVDPLAEADAMAMQGMPQGMPPQGQGSDLPTLFSAWGIEFSSGEVVGDARLALQVAAGPDRRPTRHLGLLGVTQSEFNQDDITTADLESINVGTTGSLKLSADSNLTFEPLIQSSDMAGLLPVSRFSFLPDPATLLDSFAPGEERLVIAGRLSGSLRSAYPEGRPGSTPNDDSDSAAVADEAAAADGPEHLIESSDEANIIIVADVDLLSDRMWVQTQNFFGQQMATAFADNGTFVTNALDNLSGSNDLIDVRSRATSARPFTKVEELRREAESRFRETEQNLQRELDETEQRLGSLQAARDDAGNLLMTAEQQAEIDRFIDRRTEIRQELRAVQRGLDQDIERLGTALKIVNVALVPLLLTVFVLFAVWRRNRGRRI